MLSTMIYEGHVLFILLCLTTLVMHYNHDYRSTKLKEWKQKAESHALAMKELQEGLSISDERLILDDIREKTERAPANQKEKIWREEDLV